MGLGSISALLVTVGLFLVVLNWQLRRARKVSDLDELLEAAYLEEPGTQQHDPVETQRLLSKTAGVTERALRESSLFKRLAAKVERSDWTLSPGEFVLVIALLTVIGFAIGIAAGSPPLAILLGAAGAIGPYAAVSRSVSKRLAKFEEQFPQVLDMLSASLESGAGVAQALELVVAEAESPTADEFARVLAGTRMGTPMIDGLRSMSDRIGSRDLAWTVQAMVVQTRTGGRLADILRIVAGFMRAREEIRRELRALSAEGKLSAFVLGALPFAMAAALLMFNPGYLTPLYTTTPGIVMLVLASFLLVIGFFFISRIVKIEV